MQARALAEDDPRSSSLVSAEAAAQSRARRFAQIGAPAARGVGAGREARRAGAALTTRQRARRAQARDTERSDSRRALFTSGSPASWPWCAALGSWPALIGTMRRPLDELVGASGELASGKLERRVQPGGPRELRELGQAFNAMADDLTRRSGASRPSAAAWR